MGALYPGTSVSGYNSNPPPDDGTTVATNLQKWADVKSKIGDPLNTFAASADSNITSAFGKTTDGASVVSTAVDYAATAADQGRLIKVTVSGKTVTTPDAGTVGAPFVFRVLNNSSGTITLAGNATGAQTIDGSTTQVIQPGSGCTLKTDGTNWFTGGLKAPQISTSGANFGFNAPINLGLTASVGSSLLTVAVKTVAGADPSAGDPVLIPFRDSTNANGDPVWITVSSALSINTNAVGATLASQNSKAFRFWVVAFNNAGTAVLALWHSGAGAATLSLNPLNEGTLQSTTGISGGATSAGVFYTPNGTNLSSKAFRILGYVEYTSGLGTAGTYTAAPDIVQLFGPGIKKPGEILQVVTGSNQTAATTASATYAQMSSAPAPTITPTSTTSVIEAELSSTINSGGGNASNISWSRGTTANTNIIGSSPFYQVASVAPVSLKAFDAPGTTSSQTYTIQGKIGAAATLTLNLQTNASSQVWTLKEYMA